MYLCNYLKDSKLELSNNPAERSIMIEAAKENGLVPLSGLGPANSDRSRLVGKAAAS